MNRYKKFFTEKVKDQKSNEAAWDEADAKVRKLFPNVDSNIIDWAYDLTLIAAKDKEYEPQLAYKRNPVSIGSALYDYFVANMKVLQQADKENDVDDLTSMLSDVVEIVKPKEGKNRQK